MTRLDAPWGSVFELEQIREVLTKVRPKVLAMVHAETSTGAWQPIEQVGKLCHEFGTLLLVDAVTSLGCVPLKLDEWGDRRGLQLHAEGPELSAGPVAGVVQPARGRGNCQAQDEGAELVFRHDNRAEYWDADRYYHHTAPITMVYAIREGLRLLLEEGLEPRWARHVRNHRALKAGLNAMGLEYSAAEGHQLPQLNAVKIPAGVDDLTVRKKLLTDFGIEVGGGLGDFKGKVWRIGLMGFNSRPNCVYQVVGALEQCLQSVGCKVTPGAGVAAANQAYAG